MMLHTKRQTSIGLLSPFILLIGLFTACSSPNEPNFDFDRVEHYAYQERAPHEPEESFEVACRRDLAAPVLWEELPASLSDTAFVAQLEYMKFLKKELTTEQANEVGTLFSNQDRPKYEESKCKPQYRDVLIFRKNSKITGIAKICFGCDYLYSVGAKGEIDFGTPEDYDQLYQVLYNAPRN